MRRFSVIVQFVVNVLCLDPQKFDAQSNYLNNYGGGYIWQGTSESPGSFNPWTRGKDLGGTEGVAKASPETRPPPWVNKSSYLISLVSFEVKE